MAANKNVGVEMWDPLRKPSWPCVWCGRVTTSANRTCHSCKYMELKLTHETSEEHALPPGQWVLRGGVKVFSPRLRQPSEDQLREEWAS